MGQALPFIGGMDVFTAVSAFDHLKRILADRVLELRSHALIEARGRREVERAVAARVDSFWRPIPGTEKEILLNAVAVRYGLTPVVDLTQLCGCDHVFGASRGYWRILRDRTMETTFPGVFATGNMAAVRGYRAAMLEGRSAGIFAAARLGFITREKLGRSQAPC